jgi:tRNA-Thr(GGU) m(6)t(6)A37 methyltransferase TsaA
MKGPVFKVIGRIRSPFTQAAGTPIQSALAKGVEGAVEVYPRFSAGLRDLEGFERIWLLYWFDRAAKGRLVVKPFLDDQERGVFATRAPCRPNPIGLSCVRLLGIDGCRLSIRDVDVLDGTPLLDIKPYVPQFDSHRARRTGWLQHKAGGVAAADGRFERAGRHRRRH